MSKTRQKTHSEAEHWKGLYKKVKRENIQLKKRLKSLERREHFYEEVIDDVTVENEVSCETCDNCGKGVIIETDLKYVILRRCDTCDWAERIKPNAPEEERD